MEKEKTELSICPYCGLDMNEHEGDGFCPAGTEEYGGRR